jgi:hypothetical protein
VRDGLVKKAAAKYRLSTANKMAIEEVAFEEGVKWQAERMYSEEEVLELIWKYETRKTSMVGYDNVKKWFERFKK